MINFLEKYFLHTMYWIFRIISFVTYVIALVGVGILWVAGGVADMFEEVSDDVKLKISKLPVSQEIKSND